MLSTRGFDNYGSKEEEVLERFVAKIEDEASLEDEPTKDLIADLCVLVRHAEEGRFHCFHKDGATMPKVRLIAELQEIIQKAKDGAYDN